jgi:hypothetical protein
MCRTAWPTAWCPIRPRASLTPRHSSATVPRRPSAWYRRSCSALQKIFGGARNSASQPLYFADPVIDPLLIDYVSTFVPKSTGEHFSPHVTTGIAPRDDLDRMLAESFESFTFSPAGAAVYRLGQFGTAAKKLHKWGWWR